MNKEKLSKALDNAMNNQIVNTMSTEEFSQYICSLAMLSIGTMAEDMGVNEVRKFVELTFTAKEAPVVRQIKSH